MLSNLCVYQEQPIRRQIAFHWLLNGVRNNSFCYLDLVVFLEKYDHWLTYRKEFVTYCWKTCRYDNRLTSRAGSAIRRNRKRSAVSKVQNMAVCGMYDPLTGNFQGMIIDVSEKKLGQYWSFVINTFRQQFTRLTDIRTAFCCYLQVDLGQDMRVTALSTIGVRVKNASTGNYSFMYVSQYFLAYKRDGDKTWRRYHRNDVSLTVRIDWDHFSYSISFYSSYQSVSSDNLEIH